MDRTLAGGKVQRLLLGRVGAREVTLLQVRVPGETVYVLVASGYGAGLVEVSQHARLRARIVANAASVGGPPRQQTMWRGRFEGAALLTLGPDEATFEAAAKPIDEAGGEAAGVVHGGVLRAAARGGPLLTWTPAGTSPTAISMAEPHDALRARGTEIAEALLRADAGSRRDTLRRALAKALARIERRIEAVQRDLAKMEEAQTTAARAQFFVVEAARAPRGAAELRALDWSNGEAVPVRWPLDPAKTAQSQIEAAFHRARRMKSATGIVGARLRASIAAREALSALASELERPPHTGADADDALAITAWSELESRARAAAPFDFKLVSGSPSGTGRNVAPSPTSRASTAKKVGASGGPRLPYRTFTGPSKRPILVGKSAEQNDALTLHVARPYDLWLHAKGWTGAHVVVPLGKGTSCPPDTLVEAAHLAAHFSDARGETVVEIAYTPRRYVRKPRGSAPGSVVVDREKIIMLRSRADTLRDLLAGETLRE